MVLFIPGAWLTRQHFGYLSLVFTNYDNGGCCESNPPRKAKSLFCLAYSPVLCHAHF